MGTTAYGGKGSKGRAVNGEWPGGAASCRQERHTMATCRPPPDPPCTLHFFCWPLRWILTSTGAPPAPISQSGLAVMAARICGRRGAGPQGLRAGSGLGREPGRQGGGGRPGPLPFEQTQGPAQNETGLCTGPQVGADQCTPKRPGQRMLSRRGRGHFLLRSNRKGRQRRGSWRMSNGL